MRFESSDAARPLSYKTKTTTFFKTDQVKTKTAFLKTIEILTQDLKKRSLLPSHTGIIPVTEKNLLITGFLAKFCFIKH